MRASGGKVRIGKIEVQIHRFADLAIAGDLFGILPMLTARTRDRARTGGAAMNYRPVTPALVVLYDLLPPGSRYRTPAATNPMEKGASMPVPCGA